MGALTKVDEGFFIAPQIDAAASDELRAEGIVAVINNRPDGEEEGQPSNADARASFEREGFGYSFIPVTMKTLSPEVVQAFQEAWRKAEGPVVAYCRSGMRSILLWALAEARYGARSPEDILAKTLAAGYDLSSARELLQQVAAMPRENDGGG